MDQFVIGIVTAIGGEIVKYTVAPIGRQFGYLFCYRQNVENLVSQIDNLEMKKISIDRQVEEERRKGKEIEEAVKSWVAEAERTSKEAAELLKDEGHGKAKCVSGCSFPHLALRRRLSRRAKKMARIIAKAIEKAETFKSVAYVPVLRCSFVNKGFEAFDTRALVSEEIMGALKDPSLGTIGVYGMGGIGKTTLVKDIAQKVQHEELFSRVIMVTITQSFDLAYIQQEIAEQLGLYWSEKTVSARANRLQHRLSQENKILIVLDDIWEELKLEDAGIYFKDDQSGSKILLISRDRYVLCNVMGVEKGFQVNILSDEEALKLFNKFVGDTINDNPDFKRLATSIVGECGGLPIAIETIACALRNRPLCVWEDALKQVKICPRQGYGKAYSSIRTSYDFLESEEKTLLLLCSLHKEDASVNVENLSNIYVAGQDLFADMDTLDEARNRVQTLVDRLKSHCLLLDGDHHGTIKMHDTVRDIVASIASEEKSMFCFASIAKMEGYLNKGKIKDSTAISLYDHDFEKLPEDLACPKLELLLIFDKDQNKLSASRYNHRPVLIPNEWFAEAKELRALCVDSIILESLPSSFCSLKNLQTLSVQGCTLEDIALIGELQSLIVLNLAECNFVKLPKQIRKLTRLRLLNLSGCRNLEVVEPNVISSLVQLEELYMDKVLIAWEGVDRKGRNASLSELENLPRLRVLHLAIQRHSVVPKDAFGEKLERYNIVIGRFFKRMPARIASPRLVRLEDWESGLLYQHSFQMLMKKSEALHLDRVGSENIVPKIEADGFPILKTLLVGYSTAVRHIVESTREIQSLGVFQHLETLSLKTLRNLEHVSYGKLPTTAFGQLRRINISWCKKLKNVLSISSARTIEEITVSCCDMMEEIFYHESESVTHNTTTNEAINDDVVLFPQLRSLKLNSLPNLIQFVKTNFSTPRNSAEPLFNQKVVFPRLTAVELSGIMKFELWQDRLPTNSFVKNIERLIVYKCNNLKHLLSVAISRSLTQLTNLEISDCSNIEEVVFISEPSDQEERSEPILFPKLRYVTLRSLPSLKRFCLKRFSTLTATSNGLELNQSLFDEKVAFPSLEKLTVERCDGLKYISSYEVAKRLSKLKFLCVKSCGSVEEIIHIKEPLEEACVEQISFHKLECIQFSSLPNLKKFCSISCVECPSLLKLDIYNCPELGTSTADSMLSLVRHEKEVERADLLATLNKKVVFPNLNLLQLFEMRFSDMQTLIILDCNSLAYLLPSNVVEGLSRLKELQIHGCESMKEVVLSVTKELREGRSKKISFPKLKTLELRKLPKLKRFCKTGCFECPSLTKLEIHDCPELRTFVASSESKSTSDEPADQAEETSSSVEEQLPLFSEKVVHLPESLQTLETLVVENCGRLKTCSTSSSVLFHSLTDLQVSKCHGMINLFLCSSMAKSLAQLTRLEITECEQMTEVMTSVEGDVENGDIVFSSLKTLILYCLPNLKSFYSGNANIKFPHLSKVIASECLDMKSFSNGTVITPELNKVLAKIHLKKRGQDLEFGYPVEEFWDGDLNTTINRLWESNDLYAALNTLFAETEDKFSEEHSTVHRDIRVSNENRASTSK